MKCHTFCQANLVCVMLESCIMMLGSAVNVLHGRMLRRYRLLMCIANQKHITPQALWIPSCATCCNLGSQASGLIESLITLILGCSVLQMRQLIFQCCKHQLPTEPCLSPGCR